MVEESVLVWLELGMLFKSRARACSCDAGVRPLTVAGELFGENMGHVARLVVGRERGYALYT